MGCPTWWGKPCLRAFNSIRDAFEGAVGGRSGNVQLVAVPFEWLATPAVGWCEQWWTLQQINTNSSVHPSKSPNSKRFWWHRKWIITGWIWLRISLLVDKDPVVAAICGRQLSFDSDTGDRITAVGAAQCFLFRIHPNTSYLSIYTYIIYIIWYYMIFNCIWFIYSIHVKRI